jgi:hypothetical protein
VALGDAAHAHRLDQIVHRAGRDALDVGFLDHRGQRLLRQPPRLEEEREVATHAKLGDAQLHLPGPRLPVPIPIAVALRQPLGALLAPRRPGLGISSSISRPAAKPIISRNTSTSGLFSTSARKSSCRSSSVPWSELISQPDPTEESRMTTRRHCGQGTQTDASA